MDKAQFCQKLREYIRDEKETVPKYHQLAMDAEKILGTYSVASDISRIAGQEQQHASYFQQIYESYCAGRQQTFNVGIENRHPRNIKEAFNQVHQELIRKYPNGSYPISNMVTRLEEMGYSIPDIMREVNRFHGRPGFSEY